MDTLLANPIVKVAVLPFILGLLCALALRGIHASTRMTGLVLGVAFCSLYLILEGLPPVPPVASKQKLAYLTPLAVVLGVGLVPIAKGQRLHVAVAAAFLLLCLVWLGWRKITGKPTPELFFLLLAFWLIGTAILAGTSWLAGSSAAPGGDDVQGMRAPILLLVAALASSIVAILGAYIGFSQLSGALGALLGGYLLVEFLLFAIAGKAPNAFGAEAAFALGGGWLAGMAVALLFAREVSLPAVAFVALVFALAPFAARLASGIEADQKKSRRLLAPTVYGAVVALPGAVGVAIAWVASTS